MNTVCVWITIALLANHLSVIVRTTLHRAYDQTDSLGCQMTRFLFTYEAAVDLISEFIDLYITIILVTIY